MCLLESAANFLTLFNFSGNSNVEICMLQAGVLQFTRISQLAWITIIAINLYIVVVFEKSPDQYEVIYHVSAWAFAVVFTLIPLVYQLYGYNDIWCWIKSDGAFYWWFLYYVPLILVIICVSVLYYLIWRCVMRKMQAYDWSQIQKSRLSVLTSRLRFFPIILILVNIFLIIYRVVAFFFKDPVVVLFVIASIVSPTVGLANAVTYGLDAQMKFFLKYYLYDRGCCTQFIKIPMPDLKKGSTQDIRFVEDEPATLVEHFSSYLRTQNSFHA